MSKEGNHKKRTRRRRKARIVQQLTVAVLLVLCVALCVLLVKQFVIHGGHESDSQSETIQNSSETLQIPGDSGETQMMEVTETPQSMELIERADASYERWLAAAMVTGISMQYPDFQLEKIYLSAETPLNEKTASQGVYVVFTSGGTEIVLHSVPLAEERTEAGTMDLYEEELGFATFDIVDVSQIDTSTCLEISMDELGNLIAQSLLVSIYEHY